MASMTTTNLQKHGSQKREKLSVASVLAWMITTLACPNLAHSTILSVFGREARNPIQARLPFISKEQVNKRKIETKSARESCTVHFCLVELHIFELVAQTSQYTPKEYEDRGETTLTICSNGVPST